MSVDSTIKEKTIQAKDIANRSTFILKSEKYNIFFCRCGENARKSLFFNWLLSYPTALHLVLYLRPLFKDG